MPYELIPVRTVVATELVVWFRTGPADRPLVAAGTTIAVGDLLLEQARDVTLMVASAPTGAPLEPGRSVEPAELGAPDRRRRRFRPGDRATVLYRGSDGHLRLAIGRSAEPRRAVVSGTVLSVDGRGICVRAQAEGLAGVLAWGEPVRGRLVIGVPAAHAELRASTIDVGVAGAIIVAGARVDIEALTRARALGAVGVICGGIMGKDLRQLDESQARQRASLHPVASFGLLVLDGFGQRPIASPTWAALTASAGHEVALVTDPPLLMLDAAPDRAAASGLVRVTAGEHAGREGRLLDLRGLSRTASGAYLPSGLVALADAGGGRPAERLVVALADLERLD